MLTPVREILRKSAVPLGLGPAARLLAVQESWTGLLPTAVAEGSYVIGLRGDTLVVGAAHSLVAQELRMRREAILSALGARMESPPTKIQVVVGAGGKIAKKPL